MAKKDKQVNLLVSEQWKKKVMKAAELSGKSYSDFIRYSAEKEADNIILDSV